jgi:hypothetical protein
MKASKPRPPTPATAQKPAKGRPFTFLLDPVTDKNLDILMRDKPHLDKTAAIREAAHIAARAVEAASSR